MDSVKLKTTKTQYTRKQHDHFLDLDELELGSDPVHGLTRRLHDGSLLLQIEIVVADPDAEWFAPDRLKERLLL